MAPGPSLPGTIINTHLEHHPAGVTACISSSLQTCLSVCPAARVRSTIAPSLVNVGSNRKAEMRCMLITLSSCFIGSATRFATGRRFMEELACGLRNRTPASASARSKTRHCTSCAILRDHTNFELSSNSAREIRTDKRRLQLKGSRGHAAEARYTPNRTPLI